MNLTVVARIVNSCDVMMGIHGAGLTNLVFLPSNAVLIQIIPLGGIKWWCDHYFGEPVADMDIRYFAYMIREEESTLIQQYPLDHVAFKDPSSFYKQGWMALKAVYLGKQNVKLDVRRFRATLLKALELLRPTNPFLFPLANCHDANPIRNGEIDTNYMCSLLLSTGKPDKEKA
ncbi:hypothetical protein Scep_002173 [Stephania cephalantha]|uniref:Glycosyltransferase n=1 Tax=Stephania cephalantha TaxID=152367 RepID=A0AAP0LAX8_9MAGN